MRRGTPRSAERGRRRAVASKILAPSRRPEKKSARHGFIRFSTSFSTPPRPSIFEGSTDAQRGRKKAPSQAMVPFFSRTDPTNATPRKWVALEEGSVYLVGVSVFTFYHRRVHLSSGEEKIAEIFRETCQLAAATRRLRHQKARRRLQKDHFVQRSKGRCRKPRAAFFCASLHKIPAFCIIGSRSKNPLR